MLESDNNGDGIIDNRTIYSATYDRKNNLSGLTKAFIDAVNQDRQALLVRIDSSHLIFGNSQGGVV